MITNIYLIKYNFYKPQLMARGPKKHLKKIAAPKSWMLEKLGGLFTTRPSQGPHKLR
jgi:small subunit ribosomal protein S4e